MGSNLVRRKISSVRLAARRQRRATVIHWPSLLDSRSHLVTGAKGLPRCAARPTSTHRLESGCRTIDDYHQASSTSWIDSTSEAA